ncbi:hypothetical protein JXA63_01740 [Candidatus Woesebacteria bacterium]|nr:hypothetical protein [Candidatus Woesebacteria bacterium]
MSNDNPKNNEQQEKGKENTPNENLANLPSSADESKTPAKPEVNQKTDRTLEKLKSKPTEEIKKKIHQDIKSRAFKYKTLSIIVSAILFLFLFGLSVAVSYYKNLTPPPDVNYIPKAEISLPSETPEEKFETTNWKTYSSDSLDFSFKYRPDLDIEESEDGYILQNNNKLEDYGSLFNASFRSLDNENNYTPKEYAEQQLCKEANSEAFCIDNVTENLKEYSNNNVIGIWTVYNLYENPITAVIFTNNSELYIFETSGETGENATKLGLETFDKILSTIEFTDNDVQGASTTYIPCINDNQEILSEVVQCEEVTEKSCLEYVDQFNYCMKSCLNIVDEDECKDICRPVCDTEPLEEI